MKKREEASSPCLLVRETIDGFFHPDTGRMEEMEEREEREEERREKNRKFLRRTTMWGRRSHRE